MLRSFDFIPSAEAGDPIVNAPGGTTTILGQVSQSYDSFPAGYIFINSSRFSRPLGPRQLTCLTVTLESHVHASELSQMSVLRNASSPTPLPICISGLES